MSFLGAIGVLVALEASSTPAVVTVESDSSCPSATAVRAALDALGGREAPRSAAVTVRSRADRLIIEFVWPGDAQSETRELSVESDCELRALTAAVAVASWLGILPGTSLVSYPLGVPSPEIRYAKIVPLPATTAPVGPLHSDPASVAPLLSPKAPSSVKAGIAPKPRRSWLGIGLGGSAGGGLVPGLRVELLRERAGAGFALGWMTSTLVTLPRSKTIDAGTSSWIRPAIGIAATATWRANRVQLDLDLGPLVGLTVAWGRNYPTNETDESVTWGLTGGMRLQIPLLSSQAWVELRVIDWLRTEQLQHEVLPTGPSGSATLPSLEGLLSVGWSFAI